MNVIGLLTSFFGAVALGISTQFGQAAGFGGPLIWKGPWWRTLNVAGWFLLAIGFMFQLIAVFLPRRRKWESNSGATPESEQGGRLVSFDPD